MNLVMLTNIKEKGTSIKLNFDGIVSQEIEITNMHIHVDWNGSSLYDQDMPIYTVDIGIKSISKLMLTNILFVKMQIHFILLYLEMCEDAFKRKTLAYYGSN